MAQEKRLFIEGGGSGKNSSGDTFLKDGFASLISRLSLNGKRVSIRLSGSTNATLDKFQNFDGNGAALIDHDEPVYNKTKRCSDLKVTKDLQESVFFMHLEMESWILSQPEVIELYLKIPLGTLKRSKAHTLPNAKEVLSAIFEKHRYKLPYKEQKDGGLLLELLEVTNLVKDFEQVEELQKWLNK